jgi:hypothetical protein
MKEIKEKDVERVNKYILENIKKYYSVKDYKKITNNKLINIFR